MTPTQKLLITLAILGLTRKYQESTFENCIRLSS